MRVLFVVPRFHTNLYFAVKALTLAGDEVHLYCRDQDKLEDHSFVRPVIVDAASSGWSQARHILASINPDLVVIRDVGPFSRRIFWLCVAQRRPMVGYDQRPVLQRRSLRKIVRGVFRGRPMHRMTPVYGLMSPGRRYDRHATYLPFPVETIADEQSRTYAPTGVVRIVCVGKLAEPRKNHFLLLRALEPLADKFSFAVTFVGTAKLNISGGSREYLDSLYAYAMTGVLAHRMTICADVPFRDMISIYDRHDICVLPSQKEPLGTAPLEAMARGCVPVVSSDTGSAGYVQDSDCGYVFPSGDLGSLTAMLTRLLESPAELERLGRNAARRTRQEFSLESFAKRFHELAASRQKKRHGRINPADKPIARD